MGIFDNRNPSCLSVSFIIILSPLQTWIFNQFLFCGKQDSPFLFIYLFSVWFLRKRRKGESNWQFQSFDFSRLFFCLVFMSLPFFLSNQMEDNFFPSLFEIILIRDAVLVCVFSSGCSEDSGNVKKVKIVNLYAFSMPLCCCWGLKTWEHIVICNSCSSFLLYSLYVFTVFHRIHKFQLKVIPKRIFC